MDIALIFGLILTVESGYRSETARTRKPKFCPIECDCSVRTSVQCSSRNLNYVPQSDKTNRIVSLWLKNNTIQELDDFTFINWMNLRTLDLQQNSLSRADSVSDQALKPLKKLKYLYLTRNKIKSIEFTLPSQLQMIDLSTNEIEKIDTRTFRRCKKLEQLYIHTNALTYEGFPQSISRLTALIKLQLKSNRLSKVPGLPKSLEQLSLETNHFNGTFSSDVFKKLRRLRK